MDLYAGFRLLRLHQPRFAAPGSEFQPSEEDQLILIRDSRLVKKASELTRE